MVWQVELGPNYACGPPRRLLVCYSWDRDRNIFAFSAALVTSCRVSRSRVVGVTTGGRLFVALAQLARLHNDSGDFAACSTRSLWAFLIVFLIVLASYFLLNDITPTIPLCDSGCVLS